MTKKTWFFAVIIAIYLIMGAVPAHADGDDSLYLYFPHTRLIDAQTGIVANKTWAYVDITSRTPDNLHVGAFFPGYVQLEYARGLSDEHEGSTFMLKGSAIRNGPFFLSLSFQYREDRRFKVSTAVLMPYSPLPGASNRYDEREAYTTSALAHLSWLPVSSLLLSVTSGYSNYRGGSEDRTQIPLSIGVLYEIAPVIHLKAEANFYSRREELQNTSFYAGVAMVLPYVMIEAGQYFNAGYMRQEEISQPYVGIALYM